MSEARFCYVTTTGRVTGRPHEIEIWFVRREDAVYILMGAGDRADTVRNLMKTSVATVRIGRTTFEATGRVVLDRDEAAWVRDALPRKYAHEEDGLEEWAETALPIAFDIELPPE